jgi:ATP-dependent DNA helicase RecG
LLIGIIETLFEIIPGGFAATVFAENNNVTDNRIDSLLNLINKNNKITTQKLADILGVSRMTIARDIEYLKGKGMLERIGPDKGGFWKIIK